MKGNTTLEDIALSHEKKVKTAQEIKKLAEKIATVVAAENVTIEVAECALNRVKEIMRTHTVANFTCQ